MLSYHVVTVFRIKTDELISIWSINSILRSIWRPNTPKIDPFFLIHFLWEIDTMSLERSEVEGIAQLARLKIEAADIDSYATGLNNILNLVDQMQAVDTTGVEPLANPLDAVQRLRVDEVTEANQRELFQTLAPQAEAGLYLVPKVIE